MALTDLETGRTRAFRACAVNRGRHQPVTLVDQAFNMYCPLHDSGQCVETFYAQAHLASMRWWNLLQLHRQWRRKGR